MLYEQWSSKDKIMVFKKLCTSSHSTDPCRSLPAGAQAPSESLCQGKRGHGHSTLNGVAKKRRIQHFPQE